MIRNLLKYMCAKNYRNRWSSDKAIAKIKQCSFFALHGICPYKGHNCNQTNFSMVAEVYGTARGPALALMRPCSACYWQWCSDHCPQSQLFCYHAHCHRWSDYWTDLLTLPLMWTLLNSLLYEHASRITEWLSMKLSSVFYALSFLLNVLNCSKVCIVYCYFHLLRHCVPGVCYMLCL